MRSRASSPYLRIGLWTLITTLAVGGVTLVRGPRDGEFLALVVLFAAASLAFVRSQGQFSGRRLLELPCFLTIAFLIEFGLVPVARHLGIDPHSTAYTTDDRTLVQGLLYVILGMIAFWAGCACLQHKNGLREQRLLTKDDQFGSPSQGYVLVLGFILFAIGSSAKLYMLGHHIYYYIASFNTYYSNLASAQILEFLSGFGGFALIVIAIERFSRPFNAKLNLCFWVVLATECVWGLISGMKGQLLQNFLLVGVVVSFLRPQIAKRWVLGFVAGLILIYPLFNQYRVLVREPSSITIGSPSQALQTQRLALLQAAERTDGSSGWIAAGVESTLSRLDLLKNVSTIISLRGATAQLAGHERLWMIPFYPLIPRFIWKSKPILDKGLRFSEVLGYGDETSTAITYPGDLYISFGVWGIVIGMFLLGLLARRMTNIVAYNFSRRALFFYAALFLSCANIEDDVFSFWSGFIRMLVAVSAIAWIVYSPPGRFVGLFAPRKSLPSGRDLRGTFEPQRST